MLDRSQEDTSFSQLPIDLLRIIISLLDPRDFRLSRTNKILHRLFHEPWYDRHWEEVTKQVGRSTAGEKARDGWARRYLFMDGRDHSRNDKQSRLLRLVRTGDQVSARMLDLQHNDVGSRSEILVESHVNELKSLLAYFYDLLVREFFNNENGFSASNYSGFSQLHYAVLCYKSDLTVEDLLCRGHPVDCKSRNGHTPLLIAASSGQVKTLRTLIRHQANVNFVSKQSHTPISRAASHGQAECVDALLDAGASFNLPESDGKTPFCVAYHEAIKKPIENNFCQIIKTSHIDMSLLSHQKIFLFCCQKGHVDLVSALIGKNVSLSYAIDANTSIVYKQCESLGCKAAVGAIIGNDGLWYQPTMPGFTALDLAIIFDHFDIIKILVSRMSYDSLSELLTKPHLNGRATTLQLAQAINHQEVVQYLQLTCAKKSASPYLLR